MALVSNVKLVSTSATGVQGNNASDRPALSSDGLRVVFSTAATNFSAADKTSTRDIYVKDVPTGALTLVSSTAAGVAGNDTSGGAVLSPAGDKVLFQSYASNFSAAAPSGGIYVKDLNSNVLTLIAAFPQLGGGVAVLENYQFSNDGLKVIFTTSESLSAGDVNGQNDVYIRDLASGAVTWVTPRAGFNNGLYAGAAFGETSAQAIFASADPAVAGGFISYQNLFQKDLVTGKITPISTTAAGAYGDLGASYNALGLSSGLVAFDSDAPNLVPGDSNGRTDVFLKNLSSGAIVRVSEAGGVGGAGASRLAGASLDGNLIGFLSDASNLVAGDTNGFVDLFVKNMTTGEITRVTAQDVTGVAGDISGINLTLAADGMTIAFSSSNASLVAGDVNGVADVFRANLNLSGLASANTAPTLGGARAAQPVTDKAIIAPFSTLTVTDPDVGQTETVTVTFAAANGVLSGTGFNGSGGNYAGAFTSAAAAQAALRALLFTPTENQASPGSTVTTGFTVTVSDGAASASDAASGVAAVSVNDAPMLAGISTAQTATAGSAIRPFATAVVSDPDLGQTEALAITLAGGAGTLSGGGFTQTSTGVYSLAGVSAAAAQAALRAVSFVPAAGTSGSDTLTLSVQDAPNGAVAPTTSTVTVAVAAGAFVNTAPTISGGATTAATGGTPLNPFAGVVLTDPDAGQTETVTVSFSSSAGVFGGGGFAGAGGVYTFAGSVSAAQAALRAASFTPPVGLLSTITLSLKVDDGFAQATDDSTRVVIVSPGEGGGTGGGSGAGAGGGGSVTVAPSIRYGLQTEFQNLSRALLSGADAMNAQTPVYAEAAAYRAVAAQLDSGQLSLAQAEAALAHLVDGTTGVAVASYAFFTGYTPTAAGLNYLVHSGANATDLNDAYYARFSTENRYINFAANLATGAGAGAAAFQAAYGGLSLADATAKAYLAVFGTAADGAKVSALLNTLVADGLGGQETRAQYFAQYGGDGPNGQGTKAAMVGFLLSNAVHDGSGVYGAATENYLSALAHGTAPAAGSELALHYGATVTLVGVTAQADPTVIT